MSGEITQGSIGSTIRGYFSGITRETVGTFCTAKKDMAVRFVRDIPAFMQASPSNATIVLGAANVIALAIFDYVLLSRVEKRMETVATTQADQEKLLAKKKILSFFGVGALFYGLNAIATRLHKYELSPTQLLLITACVVSYRLFRLTMPQVVINPAAEAALQCHLACKVAGEADLRAVEAKSARDNVAASLPQDLLAADTNLPKLEAEYAAALDNDEMRAVIAANDSVSQLQRQINVLEAGVDSIQPIEDDASEVDRAEQIAELRMQLRGAQEALIAAKHAAGADDQGLNPQKGSPLDLADAALLARNEARNTISANQIVLNTYKYLVAQAAAAEETAAQNWTQVGQARAALNALVPLTPTTT